MLPIQKNTYKEKVQKNKSADGTYRTWGMDTIDHYRSQFKYNNNQDEIDEIQYAIEGVIRKDFTVEQLKVGQYVGIAFMMSFL